MRAYLHSYVQKVVIGVLAGSLRHNKSLSGSLTHSKPDTNNSISNTCSRGQLDYHRKLLKAYSLSSSFQVILKSLTCFFVEFSCRLDKILRHSMLQTWWCKQLLRYVTYYCVLTTILLPSPLLISARMNPSEKVGSHTTFPPRFFPLASFTRMTTYPRGIANQAFKPASRSVEETRGPKFFEIYQG